MRPKIILSALLMSALSAGSIYAQSIQEKIHQEEQRTVETLRKIKVVYDCFREASDPKPRSENFILSSGKKVSSIVQCDFGNQKFLSADEMLRDISLWKNSPYLWKLKHRKGSKMLSDDRDLSEWEINSVDKIAKTYFEEGDAVFHIAAHGLVYQDNTPANCIRVGGQDLDAAETAELIKLSWKGPFKESVFHQLINLNQSEQIFEKQQPFTIVVHSCHSAEGEDNFAQQLSVELSKYLDNVRVIGAPDVVWCTEINGKYTEEISSMNAKGEPVGPPKRWRVYKNGQDTGQGEFDYRSTVRRIQSE